MQMLCKEVQALRAKKRRFGVFVEMKENGGRGGPDERKEVRWQRLRRAASTEARNRLRRAGARTKEREAHRARRQNKKCLLSTSASVEVDTLKKCAVFGRRLFSPLRGDAR